MKNQDLLKPIRPERLYIQIVKQIIDLVNRGEFKKGMKLPSERNLAKRLKVSRPSLRESLTVLEMIGYVNILPGQGTFIAEEVVAPILNNINIATLGESPFIILQARKAVSPAIAKIAAGCSSEASLKNIEKILDWIESDPELSVKSDYFSEGDRKFHLAIAQATENPILISIQQIIYACMGQDLWLRMMKHTSFSTPGRWEEADAEHRNIFNAIKSREQRLASKLMLEHIKGVERIMVQANIIHHFHD